MRILVIAPHPDDEVLGVGGTIARYAAEGADVYVAVVTKGDPAMFDPSLIERGRAEAKESHALLGVKQTFFLDFPAARLDSVEHHILNKAFNELLKETTPHVVFLPFGADIHRDHQITFESALVALRPVTAPYVRDIFCYETLSETNWNASAIMPSFAPTTFIDISGYLAIKLKAAQIYSSQMKQFPHERSLQAIFYLAKMRGAIIGKDAAEAFVQIRRII